MPDSLVASNGIQRPVEAKIKDLGIIWGLKQRFITLITLHLLMVDLTRHPPGFGKMLFVTIFYLEHMIWVEPVSLQFLVSLTASTLTSGTISSTLSTLSSLDSVLLVSSNFQWLEPSAKLVINADLNPRDGLERQYSQFFWTCTIGKSFSLNPVYAFLEWSLGYNFWNIATTLWGAADDRMIVLRLH